MECKFCKRINHKQTTLDELVSANAIPRNMTARPYIIDDTFEVNGDGDAMTDIFPHLKEASNEEKIFYIAPCRALYNFAYFLMYMRDQSVSNYPNMCFVYYNSQRKDNPLLHQIYMSEHERTQLIKVLQRRKEHMIIFYDQCNVYAYSFQEMVL